MRIPSLYSVTLPMAFAVFAAPHPVFADSSAVPLEEVSEVEFVEDTGAADRIHAADTLRTLSQEISASACFLHNDIEPAFHCDQLGKSIHKFDVLLDALLNGNADLHIIGAETSRKTVNEIEAIMAEWHPIHDAAQILVDNPQDIAAAHVIYDGSDHLLTTTSHLLSEFEAEYSHPTEVLMSDVMLLEIAGRQEMMTQQIAFDTCLVWSGYGGEDKQAELKTDIERFDLIARALHDGMPELGIVAAPTEEIRIALEGVVEDWEEVVGHLTHVAGGGDIDPHELEWISHALHAKMNKMEDIVIMYTEYSRRAII